MDLKFIEEIRNKRIEKDITLQDISSATRINTRFLEAIENGDFDVLPKPYVRSFIKQYAEYVGFNAFEVLSKFDEHNRRVKGEGHADEPFHRQEKPSPQSVGDSNTMKRIFLSISIIGGFALILYLISGVFGGGKEPVAERPFQEVVREIEEEARRTPIEPVETIDPGQIQQRDSLTVSVAVTDTVWLTVMIDNIIQREYIFPPGTNQEWKAANELLMTIGNAGGVSMRINGDSVGVLGNPGQVLRNVQITRDGIQR